MGFYQKKSSKKKPEKPYDKSRLESYALWLLGQFDRSEQSLRDKLEGKSKDTAAIEEVIERMIELKYIDDARYIAGFLVNATGHKMHGLTRIRQDLNAKGISRDDVSLYLEDHPIDWVQVCAALIERKYGVLSDDVKIKSKQMGFLARRGFSYSDISGAMAYIIENQG